MGITVCGNGSISIDWRLASCDVSEVGTVGSSTVGF
jgi:hypothetical protein